MSDKFNILFLCTGNSCRSQMAEAWLNHLKSDLYNAYSAGIEKHGLDPNAVKVMAECDIDISVQQSKTLEEIGDVTMDVVFTVCGLADKTCPVVPNISRKIYVGFDYPPALAAEAANEEEALNHYRRVRDEIRNFVTEIDTLLEV